MKGGSICFTGVQLAKPPAGARDSMRGWHLAVALVVEWVRDMPAAGPSSPLARRLLGWPILI